MNTDAIKTLIVDDEAHARAFLINQLKKHKNIVICDEAENGADALKKIKSVNPDLVFLDIQMPKLNGFDVLSLLNEPKPLIVFVTAYDEYALKAFEEHALDYLLKPIEAIRLQKTIDRITHSDKKTHQNLDSLVTSFSNNTVNRILVQENDDVHVVATKDIISIEAADDYVGIHTFERFFIKLCTLNKLETQLDSTRFCRIHRSSIINLEFLERIVKEGKDTHFAIMKNSKELAISRTGYSRLKDML